MKAVGVLVFWAIGLASVSPALADHKVYSPIVEPGVAEFEHRGHRTVDPAADKDNAQKHIYEVAFGVNPWWHTAIFGELAKEPGGHFAYEATAWENIFQLTPQGKYWLDVGLYAEYAKSARGRGSPDEAEVKLLLEKDIYPLVATVNLVFNRDIGTGAGKGFGFEYAARLNYPWKQELQFAVEAYGEPGRLTGFEALPAQEHVIGPVILGKLHVDGIPGVFGYDLGYLFGLTSGSPQGTAKWEIEYEIPF